MLNLIQSLSRGQKRAILLAMDALLVPVSVAFAFAVLVTPAAGGAGLVEYLVFLPYLMALAAVSSYFLGLAEVPLRDNESGSPGQTILLATFLGTCSFAGAKLAGSSNPVGLHIVFSLSYFLFFLISRLGLLRLVTMIYRRSEDRCRVLIYGAGTTGTQLALALRGHNKIEPVAFVDDNVTLQGLRILRLPVYSPLRIADLVREKNIQRVVLAAGTMSPPKQIKLLKKLEAMGLEVQALPSFAQLIGEAPLLEKLTPASTQALLGRDEVSGSWRPELNCYQDRVIMITGAGGSIGSELCRQMLELRPVKLVLFELSELALYNITMELQSLAEGLPVEIVGVLGSVTEPRQVRKVMQDHEVQVVLHAAAYKHVPIVEENPLAGLVNNVLGTQTLVQQSVKAGVERFILISSDKAVRPTNVMGASKRLAEGVLSNAAQLSPGQSGTIFATVRFGNVLGSSGSVVPLFQEQISRGGPITVTDPQVMRYFMTVQEAVKLVLESGSMAQGNEVFVLDMGAPISILQLARQMIENAGYSVRNDANPHGDIEIMITGLRRGEKMVEELTLTDSLRSTGHPKIFAAQEEVALSGQETILALRRLREAFVASDEEMARHIAMHFVETPHGPVEALDEIQPKLA